MSAKRVYLTTKSYEFLRVLHSPVLKSEHGNTTPQHSHSNKNYFLEASNSLGVPSQEFLGIAMRITRGWYTCTPGTDEKRLSTSVRVSENTLVGRHRVRFFQIVIFGMCLRQSVQVESMVILIVTLAHSNSGTCT